MATAAYERTGGERSSKQARAAAKLRGAPMSPSASSASIRTSGAGSRYASITSRGVDLPRASDRLLTATASSRASSRSARLYDASGRATSQLAGPTGTTFGPAASARSSPGLTKRSSSQAYWRSWSCL
jgi:hypothetical protein